MELPKTVKNLKVNLLKEVCDESATRLAVARPINVFQDHIDYTVSRFEQGCERLEQIELSWRESVEKVADGWRGISPLSEKFNIRFPDNDMKKAKFVSGMLWFLESLKALSIFEMFEFLRNDQSEIMDILARIEGELLDLKPPMPPFIYQDIQSSWVETMGDIANPLIGVIQTHLLERCVAIEAAIKVKRTLYDEQIKKIDKLRGLLEFLQAKCAYALESSETWSGDEIEQKLEAYSHFQELRLFCEKFE